MSAMASQITGVSIVVNGLMPAGNQPITLTNIDPNLYRLMSKLLCATPDIDICMTVFIFIYKWQYDKNYLMNYCWN